MVALRPTSEPARGGTGLAAANALLGWMALAVGCCLGSVSAAESAPDRFCIQPLKFDRETGTAEPRSVESVLETGTPEHDIFFLDFRSGWRPARLIGNRFTPITDEFPTWTDHTRIITTPDEEVIGVGGQIGDRTFYRMNGETGRFEEMQIEGSPDLDSVRKIAWSTPMDAALMTGGGSEGNPDRGVVLALRSERAIPIAALARWVTHISDFPELNLTVLVSEVTDGVYVIDGDRRLHELVELNLGERGYISQTLYLADPPRLLLKANGSRGSSRGLFLIQLDNSDGVWRPAKTQDWSNLMEGIPDLNHHMRRMNGWRAYDADRRKYFFFGAAYDNFWDRLLGRLFESARENALGLYEVGPSRLEKIDETDPDVFEALPWPIKYEIDPKTRSQTREFHLPASDATVFLSGESIRVLDAHGKVHDLDRSALGPSQTNSYIRARLLQKRGEILLWSRGRFYLLRDRRIAGPDACF